MSHSGETAAARASQSLPAATLRGRGWLRRHRTALVTLVLLGGAALLLVGLLGRGTAVVVVPARRQDLVQTLVASGRVVPPAAVTLASRLLGNVAAVTVDEGALVEEGQLLVQLDESELRAAVAQAQADLDHASAASGKLRRVSSRVSREQLRQVEADLALAEKRLERTTKLTRASAASAAELDEAHKAVEIARSRQQSALLEATSTGASGSDGRLAAAAVSRARAALAQAESRLAQAQIRAPFSGLVIRREVEPGDAVQPGAALLVVAQSGETQLLVEPDEKSLGVLALGQPAQASADAFPERRFAATVRTIAPAVDAQRGTIEVRLRVPRPPAYLRPYMTVSVEIEVARKRQALVVPAEALRDATSQRPWVLLAIDGRAQRRDVRLGIRGERTLEVAAGLQGGEQLIVSAARPLRAGQRVRAGTLAE